MKQNHLFKVLALPALALALASCADTSPGISGRSTYSDSELQIENFRPTAYPVTSADPEKIAALAKKHHPRIAALRHKADRMQALSPQAASLPDPNANVSVGSLPETAAGQVQAVLGVSQKIPLPGKRDAASRAASLEADAIRSEADALSLRIAEQVKSAWWDYYLSEKTITYTRENRSLLNTMDTVVNARIETEAAAQADQIRLQNEISLLDRDLLELTQIRDSAKARVNSLLNRPSGSSLPSPGEPSLPATASLDSLIARAESSHPDIHAAQSRLDAFGQRLRKAKLEKYPDPTVGLGYAPVSDSGVSTASNGRDQVFVTLGFNIPLWQEPRRAMIREASSGISETRALMESSRADLRYRIEDAYFRAKSARDVTALFQEKLIPSSRQAYEVSLAGYSSGKNSVTDVIATQRDLLTYQLQLVKSRAELGKAIATLQSAAAL